MDEYHLEDGYGKRTYIHYIGVLNGWCIPYFGRHKTSMAGLVPRLMGSNCVNLAER